MLRMPHFQAQSLFTMGLLLVGGCASGGSVNGGLSSGPSVESGVGGDRLSGMAEFKLAQRSTVAVPLAEAWTRLAKAYSDLGIPLTTVRPEVHSLGNAGMKRSHTLADQRLSSLLECGSGGGGANADTYSVNMSVVSELQPVTDTTTEVATLVQATAAPMSFGNPAVVCSTTGALEQKISGLIAAPRK